MTAFTEKLDRAAGAALCAGLTVAGGRLVGAGAVSLVAGGAGVVPLALGSAALMAAAYGCTWDPDAPGPPPSGEGQVGGCLQVEARAEVVFKGNGPTQPTSPPLEWRRLNQAIFTGIRSDGKYTYTLEGLNGTGTPTSQAGVAIGADFVPGYFTLNSDASNPCTDDEPIPPSPPLDIPPYEYTDPEDGCTLIVNWEGLSTDNTGHASPVFKIEPGADTLRADGGGIIGGCNFSPVIYTGNPGGPGEPPFVGPWDPTWDGDDNNPWAEFLREIAAGVLGAALARALDELFKAPYLGTTYRLVSVCETDASGEPISEAVEEIIPALPINDAILTRLDALVPLLQGQKDFKQPVCPPTKLEGEFRTISFRSENVSPNGKSCLRKRLRYRSVSGIGLDGLIDHWKDFSYSAGPVVVKHRGAAWGTITVWASSVDEGKRVILHAASEAAIDANQVGRWEISGSSSARLGMPGTMNVDTTGGYYWITARDGSNNRPLVGKT